MIHVTPTNDRQEHFEESTCNCFPRIVEQDGEMICIHQAFDARELVEEGLQPFLPTNVPSREGRMLLEGDVVETVQGNRFVCLTVMGLPPVICNREKKMWELLPEMTPNLFFIGNVVEDLELRHSFFHAKN
jgi:hypothetical protein